MLRRASCKRTRPWRSTKCRSWPFKLNGTLQLARLLPPELVAGRLPASAPTDPTARFAACRSLLLASLPARFASCLLDLPALLLPISAAILLLLPNRTAALLLLTDMHELMLSPTDLAGHRLLNGRDRGGRRRRVQGTSGGMGGGG